MTSDAPAVFEATFCGARTVGGRKQLTLTFEVPIEHMGPVLNILGTPNEGTWFAIAKLTPEAHEAIRNKAPQARSSSSPTENRNEEPPANAGLGKARTSWRDMPLAQQAGMRCGEVAFWRFLESEIGLLPGRISDKDTAADFLRRLLGVTSRSELGNPIDTRAKAWVSLNDRYEAWVRS